MDLFLRGTNAHPLLRQAQLGGKSAVWLPLPALHWRALFHHLVDLLQRQPFHLRNEEEDEGDAEETERAPNEEDLGS